MSIAPLSDTLHRPARIRFDRNELAGSFGDLGTALPLIVAMITAADMRGATVFVVYGVLQILTGVIYGLPMPLQPLKAMAVLVITQKIESDVIFGAGLAIGVIMLGLSLTGALTWLTRVIPRCAVRGVQFGLGLSLASLALRDYVPALGSSGYLLAAVCFVIVLVLWGNRRIPAALVVIALGLLYAAVITVDWSSMQVASSLALPTLQIPTSDAIWTGLIVLALPQIPLSLSNSVIATDQTLRDLFPERSLSVCKIGITYGVANILAALFGGIPVCHGCGGLCGHYAFGARTGGSVILYGAMYLVLGLLLGDAVDTVVAAYPRPVLGIILLFESLMLLLLVRDITGDTRQFIIALLVGVIACGVKQGFLVGILIGTALWYLWPWKELEPESSAIAQQSQLHP